MKTSQKEEIQKIKVNKYITVCSIWELCPLNNTELLLPIGQLQDVEAMNVLLVLIGRDKDK